MEKSISELWTVNCDVWWVTLVPVSPGGGIWAGASHIREEIVEPRNQRNMGLACSSVSQKLGEHNHGRHTGSESESQANKRHPEYCRLHNSGWNSTIRSQYQPELLWSWKQQSLYPALSLWQACWDNSASCPNLIADLLKSSRMDQGICLPPLFTRDTKDMPELDTAIKLWTPEDNLRLEITLAFSLPWFLVFVFFPSWSFLFHECEQCV